MVNPETARGIARSVGSWHRTLGDINTQPVAQPRFSAKKRSSYFVTIPTVPTEALIGPCKKTRFSPVPTQSIQAG